MEWSTSDVVAAVRSTLGLSHVDSLWTFERADLDGDQLLVVFRLSAAAPVSSPVDAESLFGVHYSLADLPYGPSTGLPCDTHEEWAKEIGWDIDEQVDTGGVARAERTTRSDGLVLLRWRGY